jgi:hypothetical protein
VLTRPVGAARDALRARGHAVRGLAVVGVAVLAVGAAGCGDEEPPHEQVRTAPEMSLTNGATGPNAIIIAQSDPVCSTSGAYAARVSWRVSQNALPAEIRVASTPPVLFASVTAGRGAAPTGRWVTTGLRFRLVDGSRRTLATAVAAPCRARR